MSLQSGDRGSSQMLRRTSEAKSQQTRNDLLHKHSMAGDETVLPAGVYYIGLGDAFDDDRRLVRIAALPAGRLHGT